MKKISQLTDGEIKQLVGLLKKVQLPAPYPVFVALLKSVPVVPVDIAIMPDKNHILLTSRNDEFYKGWHVPGSILLYKEKLGHCAMRVAVQELVLLSKDLKHLRFETHFEYFDTREHGITMFFTAQAKKKSRAGTYFPLDKIPKNFLKEQLVEINYLKNLR